MNGNAMFFDSVKGDRKYNAADFRDWLRTMFSEGVSVNDFFVSPKSGLSLTVPGGYVHIRGSSKTFDNDTTVTLAPADATHDRIDAVAIELDIPNKTIEIKTVTGTPDEAPTEPQPVRNEDIWQLILAYVDVRAGATEITAAEIEDTRMPLDKCGYLIRSACDNDMTEVVNVYRASIDKILGDTVEAFDVWFNDITATFGSEMIPNLRESVKTLDTKMTAINETLADYQTQIDNENARLETLINSGAAAGGKQRVFNLHPGKWTYDLEKMDSTAQYYPSFIIAQFEISKYTVNSGVPFYVNVVMHCSSPGADGQYDNNASVSKSYDGTFHTALYGNPRSEIFGIITINVKRLGPNPYSIQISPDDITTADIRAYNYNMNSAPALYADSAIGMSNVTMTNVIAFLSNRGV